MIQGEYRALAAVLRGAVVAARAARLAAAAAAPAPAAPPAEEEEEEGKAPVGALAGLSLSE